MALQSTEKDEKLLYAIIRKPQEGKTFICLENITINDTMIHFIITMNTIKSNKQFFERANNKFGDRLCILNSETKGLSKYQYKEVSDVCIGLIKNNFNIIIMCAHKKRFTKSIHDLLLLIENTNNLKSNIMIHIDEAHAYVPSFRDDVNKMNEHNNVERIYCYSATPFNIWHNSKQDLFKQIYVVDVVEQFNIIDSKLYFGVKDVELKIIEKPSNKEFYDVIKLSRNIPQFIIDKWKPVYIGIDKYKQWYCKENTYFSLGFEYEYLNFIKYTLSKLNEEQIIKNDAFTYNFIPGYIRVVTHYQIMNIILTIFTNALVIIFNGNGSYAYLNKSGSSTRLKIKEVPLIRHNEPSKQIEHIIKKHTNKPVFVTGFHCVNMSVTLINETMGNFDNVIVSYPQFHNSPDILYQLCRFLFNYTSWQEVNVTKIKKTKLISDDDTVYKICLEYEKQIEVINKEMAGSIRTQDEVKGNIKVKQRKKPKERTNDVIKQYIKTENTKCKPFKVYDGNDDEIESNYKQFWFDFRGKELNGKSELKKDEDDNNFYICSTTKHSKRFVLSELKKTLKGFSWDSNFQLAKNTYKYSRLYVGYDDINEPSEYTVFVRTLELEKCKEVTDFLNEQYK